MLLDALATIGDELADQHFGSTMHACCDPDALRDNQAIETVIELEFRRTSDAFSYQGTRVVDPGSPLEMALKYGYANQYNQYDHSLTQRASSSILTEFDRMIDWPQDGAIGEVAEDPLVEAIAATFESYATDIRTDLEQHDDDIDYKALLTIRFEDSGAIQYPGDLDPLVRGTFNAYERSLEKASSAKGCTGVTRCTICDEQGDTYGLGAGLDAMYALKKQWPFPQYNASNAWQSRPLCAECISNIETASKLFLDKQSYGAPGIRCRVIPYALPVADADDRLRGLIRGGYENLTDSEAERPLSNAWEDYRTRTELLDDDEVLRLSFVHYIRDSNKAHGVASIDGVSIDQLERIIETFNTVLDTQPLFQIPPFSDLSAPTEKQVFTGKWLYNLLCGTSDRDTDGNPIGDDNRWANYTEALLTDTPLQYSEFVSGVTQEAVIRYRDRLSDDDTADYPYDGFHIAQAFAFQRTCARLGVITDDDITHTMTLDSITDEYESFGEGLAAWIDTHESINQSPGRTAGFVLGAVAARLSAWQQRRNLNRTFVQNRDIAHLSATNLTRWETAIWEKAKTYNAQSGRYGTPWSKAHELFHQAILRGENEGWNATKDEIQYHFILGVTFGPKIHAQAKENRQDSSEAETTTEDSTVEQSNATEHTHEN